MKTSIAKCISRPTLFFSTTYLLCWFCVLHSRRRHSFEMVRHSSRNTLKNLDVYGRTAGGTEFYITPATGTPQAGDTMTFTIHLSSNGAIIRNSFPILLPSQSHPTLLLVGSGIFAVLRHLRKKRTILFNSIEREPAGEESSAGSNSFL